MNFLNPQQAFTNQLAKKLACLEALKLQNRQAVSAFEKDILAILKQLNVALVGETENDITSLRSFAKIIRDFLASIPKSVYGGCKTKSNDYLVMFIVPSYIDPIDHEDIKMTAHIYKIMDDGTVDMQQRIATYAGESIEVTHIMDVSKYKSGDTIDLNSVKSCIRFGEGSDNELSRDDYDITYANFQLKIEGDIIISSPFDIKFKLTTLEFTDGSTS